MWDGRCGYFEDRFDKCGDDEGEMGRFWKLLQKDIWTSAVFKRLTRRMRDPHPSSQSLEDSRSPDVFLHPH